MDDTWNNFLIWIEQNPNDFMFYFFLLISIFGWIYLPLAIKYRKIFAEPSTPTFTFSLSRWLLIGIMGKENYQDAGATISIILAFCMAVGGLVLALVLKFSEV